MVNVKGKNLNITKELQDLLLANPKKSVKKPVISKVKDDKGDLVHEKDYKGELKYDSATINIYPKVYFDVNGTYYLRAFPSKTIDGKEILITNPNIKVEENCNWYGKGAISHRQIIPGSELWDNGSDSSMQHREIVCKGDPETRIVTILTYDEVLAVDLKPQGQSLAAQFANLSDTEKSFMAEQFKKFLPDTSDEE